MSNLALDYDDAGKYAQAETLNAETLEIEGRVLGPRLIVLAPRAGRRVLAREALRIL